MEPFGSTPQFYAPLPPPTLPYASSGSPGLPPRRARQAIGDDFL
jgi:hypothetical protein